MNVNAADLSKAIERGERFLNSFPPKYKAVVTITVSVATAIVAIPPACKSLTKLAHDFPEMAENFNKGFNILKPGSSNLIADVVDEAKIVDGEAAA